MLVTAGFFKALLAFLKSKISKSQSAYTIYIRNAEEFVNATANKQNNRHIDADQGAVGIGEYGGRIQLVAHFPFPSHKQPHNKNWNQPDDHAPKGSFWFMGRPNVVNARKHKPADQNVKRHTGYFQGGFFKGIPVAIGVFLNP